MAHLPNFLSLFRILLVPVLVTVLFTKFEGREYVGLVVFLLASLTDFLDGFFARRHNRVTRIGKLLDPAADKILTSAAFISLVELDLAPAWMVAAIVAREFAVSTLRSVLASEDVIVGATLSGKIKTTVQIVAISVLIIKHQLGDFSQIAPLLLWLALITSVYSGIEYFARHMPHLVSLWRSDIAAAENGDD
jgi:CDP-diacylglycerol--glycerol-3-phosphate 3-phosphatidyltransferase